MTGRRQEWAGSTRSTLSLAYVVLALGLTSGLVIGLAQPGAAAGLGGATLIAAAVLVSLQARQWVLQPLVRAQVPAMARAGSSLPPAPIRAANPDSPGRPRPRAPGCVATARPA